MTITTQEQAALTSAEQQLLQQHEQTIDRGLQTFYAVGYALADIRDQRLYRTEYGTFEEYCQQRWQMRRDYANKLIAASEVMGNLNTIVSKPANEAQARPLAKLPPEEQPEAWEEAVKRSDGKPTAKVVEQVVKERTQPPMPPEPEPAAAEEPAAPRSSLPPGWYFQASSNPADIIAINRENASQASGFCQTHEEAASRAWEVHRKQERPEAKKPEPKKASVPAPEPAPAPVPDELIELLRTVNPDAGPHSFGSRIAADGKSTQYRVSVPTGSGGSISTDWHRADYLRQWMEGHIEKLQGYIRDNVNAMQKIGFRLSGDVVWQRVDQHRLMPFYPLASNTVNPELWSETQVQSVLVFHVRMNDRLRKEQDEVSKARKELARLDVRRHELEQQVKQLTARLEEGAGSI